MKLSNETVTIELKNGTSHEFSNIPRGEYNNMFNYMTDKNIAISKFRPRRAPGLCRG